MSDRVKVTSLPDGPVVVRCLPAFWKRVGLAIAVGIALVPLCLLRSFLSTPWVTSAEFSELYLRGIFGFALVGAAVVFIATSESVYLLTSSVRVVSLLDSVELSRAAYETPRYVVEEGEAAGGAKRPYLLFGDERQNIKFGVGLSAEEADEVWAAFTLAAMRPGVAANMHMLKEQLLGLFVCAALVTCVLVIELAASVPGAFDMWGPAWALSVFALIAQAWSATHPKPPRMKKS